jgi:hypothetical protein
MLLNRLYLPSLRHSAPRHLLPRTTVFSRTVMQTPSPYLTPSHTPGPRSKILVLGAGNFGSCLADHLGDSEHDVFMWSRENDIVEHFNKHHKNPRYLKDHSFAMKIKAIGPELPDTAFIKGVDVVLFAIPTEGIRYIYAGACPRRTRYRCSVLCFVTFS